MSGWSKAKNVFTRAYQGWTTKYNRTGRHDTEAQEAFRNDVFSGKTVFVKNAMSSRYQYDRSNTLYDPNDVAEKDEGNTESKVTERAVESTAIESFQYNPETKVLSIKFQGGNTWYDYPNVPPEVVTEFMESPSKGRYVATVIGPQYSEK